MIGRVPRRVGQAAQPSHPTTARATPSRCAATPNRGGMRRLRRLTHPTKDTITYNR